MDVFSPRECYVCKNRNDFQALWQCSFCGNKGEDPAYFCVRQCCELSCRKENCSEHPTCWEAHLPSHTSLRKAHQRVSQLPQIYVKAVTYSEPDPTVQMNLHNQDRIAQWFVVKLGTSERHRPTLCVSDRFRQLCNPGISENRWSSTLYPSFVSFIGDTGTGKSTLTRAMILMGQVNAFGLHGPSDARSESKQIEQLRILLSEHQHGPVTRTANLKHLTDPTTTGVHLYKDVAVSDFRLRRRASALEGMQTPILFADCEGFGAGSAQTNSERAHTTENGHHEGHLDRSSSVSMGNPGSEINYEDTNPNLLFAKEIIAPSYRNQGKEGAELFYARFLYAFSDVIVFVINGDQRLQDNMQRLLEWAASAVNKSINHLAQKTLIIVRNMANRHATEFYDRQFLKSSILDNLQNLWEGSKQLTEFRDNYNTNSRLWQRRIHTNADFFGIFFQEVDVCYIPDIAKAPMEQVFKQYSELRDQIVRASETGQVIRSKSWSQYNVPTLSHLLSSAFEHFRATDKPFDFYTAARKDNPNPISVADHIANFLRHLQFLRDKPNHMFVRVVAICLASWAFKNFKQALEPEDIFRKDLESWCRDGIRIYRERYQDCGFRFENGLRCITRRHGHEEHCDEKGSRSAGIFDPAEYQEEPAVTIAEIRNDFTSIYRNLCSSDPKAPGIPNTDVLIQKRESTLEEFAAFWNVTKSNKTCFTCLQSVPDHVLSCGHGYCPDCIKDFGQASRYFEYALVMHHCILCKTAWHEAHSQLIRLKPSCAGVRLLTLDGGGVRGIIELTLLERLELRIGLNLPIREFFDLIVGTSTGGIITLGLGMTELNAGQMRAQFMDIAESTFRLRREGIWTLFDPLQIASKTFMLFRIYDSIYSTTPLKEALMRFFGKDLSLFSSAKVQQQQRSTRVAVTSTKDTGSNRCLITNYNRPAFSSGDDFEREDDESKDMKVWEAGLATSAAPFYFTPFVKSDTMKDYTDGALHANLPVEYALQEMTKIWPSSVGKAQLDALVSVGTGIQKKEISIPKILEIGGFKQICTSFFNNLDTTRLWNSFKADPSLPSNIRSRVHRLNANITGDYVALDEYKKMKDMDQMIADQMTSIDGRPSPLATEIAKVADVLTASLFFFEPDYSGSAEKPFGNIRSGGRHQITGSIRCRLARNSQELKQLVNLVQGFWRQEIRRTSSGTEASDWVPIRLAENWRNAVRRSSEWFRIPCKLETFEASRSQLVLAVSLLPPKDEQSHYSSVPIPISGFPVSFEELEKRAKSIW